MLCGSPQSCQNHDLSAVISSWRGFEAAICHWRFDPGGTNSLWTMPWMSKKNDQRCLDIAANVTRFFRLRWIWWLPLQRQLLSLTVITTHPRFIIGYDIGDEVGVVSGMLFEFPAVRKAMGLLVVAQQSWYKSRRNASQFQIFHQNALNGPVWQALLSHKHRG